MKTLKYHNKKTEVDGITFDSKAEGRRYGELKTMQRAGLIHGLESQPEFPLIVGGVPIKFRCGKGWKMRKYVADFRYVDAAGMTIVEDVKGVLTEAYKLKRDIVRAMVVVITEITR